MNNKFPENNLANSRYIVVPLYLFLNYSDTILINTAQHYNTVHSVLYYLWWKQRDTLCCRIQNLKLTVKEKRTQTRISNEIKRM